MFWLNVDYPTHDAKLHIVECDYAKSCCVTQYKGIGCLKRDGGWLSFPSKPEVDEYIKQQRIEGKTLDLSCCPCCAKLKLGN